jgi:hypothetical protein
MAIIITLVIILACVAQQIIFSSLARSLAMLISAIAGALIAFNFYEALAGTMIGSGMMASQAHGVAMGLIFVLAFGIMVAVSTKLLSGEIAFEGLVDKIGGATVAVFTGYVISGVIIASLSLASSSNSFPYERFSANKPDMQNPSGALLSPDGFQAALFGFVSDGSLAGDNSFAALHAGFNDAAAMDRLGAEKKLSPLAAKSPFQGTALLWPAPADITGPDGKKIEDTPGSDLLLLRLNIAAGKDADFLLGQLRMVCRSKDAKGPANSGSGTSIHPVGYMKTATSLLLASADTIIPPSNAQATNGAKTIDLAFYVPNTLKPSLIELKRNFVMTAPTISEAKDVLPTADVEKPKEVKTGAEPNAPR